MILLCPPHRHVQAHLLTLTFVVICLSSCIGPCKGTENYRFTSRQQASIEFLYNSLRGNIKNAADMIRMKWSNDMTTSAIEWVKHCDYGRAPPTLDGMDEISMRLFVYSDTSKSERYAYNKWSSHTKSFYSLTPTCRGGDDCREYRKMIVANTTFMGCAFSLCNNLKSYPESKKGYLYICIQGPGKPLRGKHLPYTLGQYCSKCPRKYKSCVRKLCTERRSRLGENGSTPWQPTPSKSVTMVTIVLASGLSYILVA